MVFFFLEIVLGYGEGKVQSSVFLLVGTVLDE